MNGNDHHPPEKSFRPLPVFVYGTLLRGMKNHPRYLAGRYRSCRSATIAGRLGFEPQGGYPFLLPGPGTVHGELYTLYPDLYRATLNVLDALEDYDPADEAQSIYLRRRATALLDDGSRQECWVYYWNGPPDVGRPVPGGDFRACRQSD